VRYFVTPIRYDYPLGLLIELLYTKLRASTVLQRAGAVLWTGVSVNTTSAPSAHRPHRLPVFVNCHSRRLGIDRQCTHSLHRNDMAYCHFELCHFWNFILMTQCKLCICVRRRRWHLDKESAGPLTGASHRRAVQSWCSVTSQAALKRC